MRQSNRHFLTGLTSLIAIVGLVYLLFRFGELESFVRPTYTLTVKTNRAAGVRPGSEVELNGVRIGVVHEVVIGPDANYPVEILARIETRFNIPRHAEPRTVETLIGGSATLLLVADPIETDEPQAFLPVDGTAVILSLQQTMIERIMAELEQQFLPLVAAMEQFQRLSATYIEVGENINALIGTAPDGPADQQTIRSLVLRMNERLDQIGAALENANQWLGDDQLRVDARSAVNRAVTLIEHATEAVDRYARLADELDGKALSVSQAIVPVADQLALTLSEVRAVLVLATSGDGTVAQALNSPDLYLSLTDAARRLEQTLVEAQLLIQKLRAEGITIGL